MCSLCVCVCVCVCVCASLFCICEYFHSFVYVYVCNVCLSAFGKGLPLHSLINLEVHSEKQILFAYNVWYFWMLSMLL